MAQQTFTTGEMPTAAKLSANATDAESRLIKLEPVVYALADAATIAVDWANGTKQSVTLGDNRTFTFANPINGGDYELMIKQDATGSRTVTWPAITWEGGAAPTLTSVANKTDFIILRYRGGVYYGRALLNY